mmetsp:Transcript_36780/g.88646  ORF Transcript_36780/g.88646 Transcript_36780/m.88646 type:complete len:474 (+) Transcript_36780:1629-3050(+)
MAMFRSISSSSPLCPRGRHRCQRGRRPQRSSLRRRKTSCHHLLLLHPSKSRHMSRLPYPSKSRQRDRHRCRPLFLLRPSKSQRRISPRHHHRPPLYPIKRRQGRSRHCLLLHPSKSRHRHHHRPPLVHPMRGRRPSLPRQRSSQSITAYSRRRTRAAGGRIPSRAKVPRIPRNSSCSPRVSRRRRARARCRPPASRPPEDPQVKREMMMALALAMMMIAAMMTLLLLFPPSPSRTRAFTTSAARATTTTTPVLGPDMINTMINKQCSTRSRRRSPWQRRPTTTTRDSSSGRCRRPRNRWYPSSPTRSNRRTGGRTIRHWRPRVPTLPSRRRMPTVRVKTRGWKKTITIRRWMTMTTMLRRTFRSRTRPRRAACVCEISRPPARTREGRRKRATIPTRSSTTIPTMIITTMVATEKITSARGEMGSRLFVVITTTPPMTTRTTEKKKIITTGMEITEIHSGDNCNGKSNIVDHK